MAFSMDQIKKTKKKGVSGKILFGAISSLKNIPDDGIRLFNIYTQVRLNRFGTSGLTAEAYKFMLKDLITNCCGKNYVDISPQDVSNNINSILYNLKLSLLKYEKDKRLLYKHTLYFDDDYLGWKILEQDKPKNSVVDISSMTDEELEDFIENGDW